jgi:hypothetical protein
MTPEFLLSHTMPAAMALLPAKMDTPEALAMLITIALQESALTHRTQVGGPARGYWQFELLGGVTGVMTYYPLLETTRSVCDALGYPRSPQAIYQAIADNDVLACAFARLLLWTLPAPLPRRGEVERAWSQYRAAWRPGRPRHETWEANFDLAWASFEPNTDLARDGR